MYTLSVILFVIFIYRISRRTIISDFCGERELSLRAECLFTRQFVFKPLEIMDTNHPQDGVNGEVELLLLHLEKRQLR